MVDFEDEGLEQLPGLPQNLLSQRVSSEFEPPARLTLDLKTHGGRSIWTDPKTQDVQLMNQFVEQSAKDQNLNPALVALRRDALHAAFATVKLRHEQGIREGKPLRPLIEHVRRLSKQRTEQASAYHRIKASQRASQKQVHKPRPAYGSSQPQSSTAEGSCYVGRSPPRRRKLDPRDWEEAKENVAVARQARVARVMETEVPPAKVSKATGKQKDSQSVIADTSGAQDQINAKFRVCLTETALQLRSETERVHQLLKEQTQNELRELKKELQLKGEREKQLESVVNEQKKQLSEYSSQLDQLKQHNKDQAKKMEDKEKEISKMTSLQFDELRKALEKQQQEIYT